MLLNIILSDFQQVIQFFVSPEKCENPRYNFLTLGRRYAMLVLDGTREDWFYQLSCPHKIKLLLIYLLNLLNTMKVSKVAKIRNRYNQVPEP